MNFKSWLILEQQEFEVMLIPPQNWPDVQHLPIGMSVYGNMPFRELIAVENALCSDGRRRRATITGQPDTYFSIPAKVKYQGKTVSGFITTRDSDYHFLGTGRNKDTIPDLLLTCYYDQRLYLDPQKKIMANLFDSMYGICWEDRIRLRDIIQKAEEEYLPFHDWLEENGYYYRQENINFKMTSNFIQNIIEAEGKLGTLETKARRVLRDIKLDKILGKVLRWLSIMVGQHPDELDKYWTDIRMIQYRLGRL